MFHIFSIHLPCVYLVKSYHVKNQRSFRQIKSSAIRLANIKPNKKIRNNIFIRLISTFYVIYDIFDRLYYSQFIVFYWITFKITHTHIHSVLKLPDNHLLIRGWSICTTIGATGIRLGWKTGNALKANLLNHRMRSSSKQLWYLMQGVNN